MNLVYAIFVVCILLQVSGPCSTRLCTMVLVWPSSHWSLAAAAAAASVTLLCLAAVLTVRLTAAKPALIAATGSTGTSVSAAAAAADTDTGSTTSTGSADAACLNSMNTTSNDKTDSGVSNNTVAAAAAAAATAGTAPVSSSLFWDVINVLKERRAVPQELWCVSKALNIIGRDSMPITVNIAAGTSAATMRALLRQRVSEACSHRRP
jgi:hypothetical protein